MACVGLITFAEMGSSHSRHYVLYSEDDSFLCACVCVCMRVIFHPIINQFSQLFLCIVQVWRWYMPLVHALMCVCVFVWDVSVSWKWVRVCIQHTLCYQQEFTYPRVCFCVWEWVTEMCVCVCEREREWLIQSYSLSVSGIDPRAVLIHQQVAHQPSLIICHETDTHLVLMINLSTVSFFKNTDLCRVCDSLTVSYSWLFQALYFCLNGFHTHENSVLQDTVLTKCFKWHMFSFPDKCPLVVVWIITVLSQ